MGKERGAETQQRSCLARPKEDLLEHPSEDYIAAEVSATAQTQGETRMPWDGAQGMLDLKELPNRVLCHTAIDRI